MMMKRKMHLMCLMTRRKLLKSLLENIYRSSNLTRLERKELILSLEGHFGVG